ncbi:predicted protein [Micromonas commoda]|uniref:Uncharacterized protein n=1 Tax=Micromonas commoda (strain RCC299 / NOUM17 / CCMP2709) TaxID=296587 RepID=C1EG92_MICCC|nr:predicted protein [Micromonas commoda]ACO66737.1 predicted protein [Micromonas commoda]|eukprot:XP_002505479.1 predicted protein [Micromonas commoda]
MAERKARLKALRQAKEAAEGGAPAEETKDGGEEPPVLKFRNYLPKDEVLGEAVMKATKAPEFEPVEAKPLAVAEEDDIYDLLPKRENIDLKNHVERKMQKLERKTQRAMIELMQAEEERRMRERGEETD